MKRDRDGGDGPPRQERGHAIDADESGIPSRRGRAPVGGWFAGLIAVMIETALLAACGGAPMVPLNNEWPAEVGSYGAVTRKWTRSTSLSASYQQVLSVDATLLSPEWRAAQAARDAELRGLGPAARQELFDKARQQAETGPWELELLVTTWDRRENDLHRGKRATWKVALLDEQGNEIQPIEIVKDRRPRYMVQADFEHHGDFAEPYLVRFPRDKQVMGPGVRAVRLRLASVRGAVELSWRAP